MANDIYAQHRVNARRLHCVAGGVTMTKALEIFAAITGTAVWLAIIYIMLAI